MKKTLIGVLIAATTTIGSAAFAQPPQPTGEPGWTPPPSAPEPPPPPQAPYVYNAPAPAPAAPIAAQAGQWVYTNQYGWIWMPYGANYSYVADGGGAYTYAYYPRFGWRWVSSPWVLNVGPSPFWGRLGPSHFAWYGRPHVIAHGGWYGGRPAYRAPAPAYRAPAPRFARTAPGRAGHHR